jgi:hypothetical protein
MPRRNRLKVTPSTGNVFRDLGFSADEAEHLLIRADLLIQLQKAIASRELTQAKARHNPESYTAVRAAAGEGIQRAGNSAAHPSSRRVSRT